MSQPYRLGFIGVGVINSSIIKGLCTLPDEKLHAVELPIYVSPRNTEKVAELVALYGGKIHVCESNEEVVQKANVLVLGVGGAVAEEVLRPLAPLVTAEHHVINLIALMSIPRCCEVLGGKCEVSKAIPLPPVAHHRGVTVVCPVHPTPTTVFELVGSVVGVDTEEQQRALQVVTSQMGPMYRTCLEVQKWLEGKGVDANKAAMFTGGFFHCVTTDAAIFGKADGSGCFERLISEQTPGGLNEQAIRELEQRNVYQAQQEVLEAILDRMQKC
eukprot:Sspe_Gene.68002::Locus_40118_Transcript_1_1_Confidence_1.000_Length_952::g.68002::m.68002/K00286/proC; pyrroline-5-carboxylate reductase